jgi:hypothetical protein
LGSEVEVGVVIEDNDDGAADVDVDVDVDGVEYEGDSNGIRARWDGERRDSFIEVVDNG